MCGRYVIYTADELVDLRDIVAQAQRRADAIQAAAADRDDLSDELRRQLSAEALKVTSGEVFPTNIAPVLIPPLDAGAELMPRFLESHPMIWGYPQFGGRKGVVFNTRLETAYDKSFWRDSLERRRCIIPMSAFIEWQHGGLSDRQRYLFDLPDEPVLYLAGIYKSFPARDVLLPDRFSIMTTIPNDSIRKVHDRMPVVLRSDEVNGWLNANPFAYIKRDNIELRQRIA